ncbi:MAG: hypothetical protein RBG13Loki_2234 [Promethearchaeota archaeon CR_4]|nr:MAG: hypothetical protein RBG13Loki_2234 [Candidatus Lokiarchaeota archaeon CR_4]
MGLFKRKTLQSAGKKKKEKPIRLCPRCMKPMSRPAFNLSGWGTPKDFTCYHCGYSGHFFVEVDPSEVDLQKLDDIKEGRQPPDEMELEEGNEEEDIE